MLLLVLTSYELTLTFLMGSLAYLKCLEQQQAHRKCSVSVVIIIHFVAPSILLLPQLFLMERLARVEVTQLTPAPTCKA